MKLNAIKPAIVKFIDNSKYNKEQKILNKFVHVDPNINPAAYNEIMKARKTIANYAISERVTVDIYNFSNKEVQNTAKPNELTVIVQDILHGKSLKKNMSDNVNATHKHVEEDYFVVDYPWDGTQQTRITTHEYEDNFLRALYRNISDMVGKLQGKK